MVRGLIVGFLWGGVLSAVLALVLMLGATPPRDRMPTDAAVPPLAEAAPGDAQSDDGAEVSAAGTDTEPVDAEEPAPEPAETDVAADEAPAPDPSPVPETADTVAEAQPETDGSQLEEVAEGAVTEETDAEPDSPVASTDTAPEPTTEETSQSPEVADPQQDAEVSDAQTEVPVTASDDAEDALPEADTEASAETDLAQSDAPDPAPLVAPQDPSEEITTIEPPVAAPQPSDLPAGVAAPAISAPDPIETPGGPQTAISVEIAEAPIELPAALAETPVAEVPGAATQVAVNLATPLVETVARPDPARAGAPETELEPTVAADNPARAVVATPAVSEIDGIAQPETEETLNAEVPQPDVAGGAPASVAQVGPAAPETAETPAVDAPPDDPGSEITVAELAVPEVSAESPRPPSAEPAPAPATANAALSAPQAQTAPDAETDAPVALDRSDPEPQPEATQPVVRSPIVAGESRLPGIGLPAVSRIGAGQEMPPPADQDEPEAPDTRPAIEAFAAENTAQAGAPQLAVVLIDDPAHPVDGDILIDLPMALSFAVDPTRADAGEVASVYRAQGLEVLIELAGLAGPDLASELVGAVQVLPEAVAFLDDDQSTIQSDRAALETVIAQMGATGHGLLAYPRGLNTAERTAERADLPAATLFRAVEDEDPAEISRILDRAAFAAGQSGSAVVLAPARPEVIATLFSWALGDRSESVALVPVSAVLMQR